MYFSHIIKLSLFISDMNKPYVLCNVICINILLNKIKHLTCPDNEHLMARRGSR